MQNRHTTREEAREAARTLRRCNGADLSEWTKDAWPDQGFDDAINALLEDDTDANAQPQGDGLTVFSGMLDNQNEVIMAALSPKDFVEKTGELYQSIFKTEDADAVSRARVAPSAAFLRQSGSKAGVLVSFQTRKRKLKVFSCNLDGKNEAIMATFSQKDFMKKSGASRAYTYETGCDREMAQALSAPGTIFIRRIDASPNTPWQRLTPK